MIVALIIIVVAVWIGLTAQQMGQDFMMYGVFGIAALCFIMCLAIASGRVSPASYVGSLDM